MVGGKLWGIVSWECTRKGYFVSFTSSEPAMIAVEAGKDDGGPSSSI